MILFVVLNILQFKKKQKSGSLAADLCLAVSSQEEADPAALDSCLGYEETILTLMQTVTIRTGTPT